MSRTIWTLHLSFTLFLAVSDKYLFSSSAVHMMNFVEVLLGPVLVVGIVFLAGEQQAELRHGCQYNWGKKVWQLSYDRERSFGDQL